jgi:hypothetical protein
LKIAGANEIGRAQSPGRLIWTKRGWRYRIADGIVNARYVALLREADMKIGIAVVVAFVALYVVVVYVVPWMRNFWEALGRMFNRMFEGN